MKHQFLTRRNVLRVAVAAGGGFVLGVQLSGSARAAGVEADAASLFVPNAFIQVDPHGGITLILPHTEFGQGVYTSGAMLIGEELEVALDQIKVQAAPPDRSKYLDPLLGDQATGGSTSTRADWTRLRQAGAAARIMLIAAAAEKWGVDPATCNAARGMVHHDATGRALGYGDLAAEATKQSVPHHVTLKEPASFELIGTRARRLDIPSKLDGTATFGIDVRLPGMRIGTLAIAPVRGGKLVSLDEAAARKVHGVRDVVRAGDHAVAVIGDHMWAAIQGLRALNPVWNAGANAGVTVETIVAAMDHASQQPGVVARREGDAAAAIAGAPTKLSAIYQVPFLAHAAMEPLNCTLHVLPDRAEIWVGTQVPVRAQKAVADAARLPPEKVKVNNLYMGGSFGRRLEIDSIILAAAIARQVPYPVKLVWTREEDMRHDYYRPYYYDRVAAGLDASGRLVGRTHRVTGPSILARWAPSAFQNGLDSDAVDCAAVTPYDEIAVFADYVRHEPRGMNTSWWRGVGPTHNVFVVESFVDEMAAAATQDPVAFRRTMLQKNPRALAVLNLAVEKAGWNVSLPAKIGRGVAVQFAFGSYLCCVMEVEMSKSKDILLRRAVLAVDCGMTVNPDTVQAQLQGGLIFGLGAALYNEITLTAGAVDQGNFDTYRSLRINEAPRIEVYHIRSSEPPGGIGEAGTAIAAPALGNAIFAATGRRLRKLPFMQGSA